MKSEMREYICDRCKKPFISKGEHGIKIPVLCQDLVYVLTSEYESIDDFSNALSENRDELSVEYNTYDLCDDCIPEVIPLRSVPFPSKKYRSGPLTFHGDYRTVMVSPEFDPGEAAKEAFIASQNKTCETCKRNLNGICAKTQVNAQSSYKFLRERYDGQDGCYEWAFDDFMGQGEIDYGQYISLSRMVNGNKLTPFHSNTGTSLEALAEQNRNRPGGEVL